eukprot:gnl/Hemi2/25555_TR8591_c0_g1_i1.p3 gnl/Hemi2/25555_TR8591_c0_g1~~gnl/Hemi2/25555_TR8591_c0_g1_i1.p3  ORF type:complete len:110 (-),score=35.19 gnl/Hemi2/25555_TR8591_c0_g1_i1:133-462(-)
MGKDKKKSKNDKGTYEQGLFGCCADIGACCYVCFCPACATGSMVGNMYYKGDFDWAACCSGGLLCVQCMLRKQVQHHYKITDWSFISNCGAAMCCSCCALVQDYHQSTI